MLRSILLILTACLEAAAGLFLIAAPAVAVRLLLGVEQVSAETAFVAQIAGAALVAIGVGCWLGRNDWGTRAQRALVASVLVYSATVTGLLVYAGLALNLAGVALWPAVVVHVLQCAWSVLCFRNRGRTR
jgi:hypothetical protein